MQNPSITLNAPSSQTREQVPLRDYLNTRIAPFLKKALTESLDKEPEYPLQWLGECLINQSILYEGNTEAEKLKEHFRYTFAVPQPQSQAQPQPEEQPPAARLEEATNGVSQPEPPAPNESTTVNGQETTATSNTNTISSESVEARPSPTSSAPAATAAQPTATLPASETAATATGPLPPSVGDGGHDTEMGGTT